MSPRGLVALAPLALAACPGEIDDLSRYLDAAPADRPAGDATVGDVTARDVPSACATDVERGLLPARCGTKGCHAGTDPVSGLDLASPGVAARVTRVMSRCRAMPLVVPGDPEGSFLFVKIAQARPACGRRMPIGAALSDAETACFRAWIVGLAAAPRDAGAGD